MKRTLIFVGFFCILAMASQLNAAATLYGSTSGSNTGELYTLDPANGAVVLDIGPLKDTGGSTYPVTGLAFHPTSGILYGSTGNSGPAGTGAKLVTINPATAGVTVVGAFNVGAGNTMTDLTFSTTGSLYGIGSVGGAHLYSVNTSTGQATLVGSSGFAFTTGGALAANFPNVFYGSPDSTHFGTYNQNTGAYTQIAAPATLPVSGGGIDSMCFNLSTLYAINNSGTAPHPTHLININLASGAVSDLGASVNQLDAIAFRPVSTVEDWTNY